MGFASVSRLIDDCILVLALMHRDPLMQRSEKKRRVLFYKQQRNRPLSICARFDMVAVLEGFLALSFDFLHIFSLFDNWVSKTKHTRTVILIRLN